MINYLVSSHFTSSAHCAGNLLDDNNMADGASLTFVFIIECHRSRASSGGGWGRVHVSRDWPGSPAGTLWTRGQGWPAGKKSYKVSQWLQRTSISSICHLHQKTGIEQVAVRVRLAGLPMARREWRSKVKVLWINASMILIQSYVISSSTLFFYFVYELFLHLNKGPHHFIHSPRCGSKKWHKKKTFSPF